MDVLRDWPQVAVSAMRLSQLIRDTAAAGARCWSSATAPSMGKASFASSMADAVLQRCFLELRSQENMPAHALIYDSEGLDFRFSTAPTIRLLVLYRSAESLMPRIINQKTHQSPESSEELSAKILEGIVQRSRMQAPYITFPNRYEINEERLECPIQSREVLDDISRFLDLGDARWSQTKLA